jgi:starch synthase
LISRITPQKGIDFTVPALREVLATEPMQFVGLGADGDAGLQSAFEGLGWGFPHKSFVMIGKNFPLAQKIYAGSDLLLVPSRYEPCGLTQIIAMRYGSLPLVRETGGLKDTVENYDNAHAERGTGFSFLFEEADALAGTLRWALDTYHNKRSAWERMQERGMRHDWSWDKSSSDYIRLYEAALAKKRSWRNNA